MPRVLKEKSPASVPPMARLEMLKGAVPVSMTVIACGLLVVPTI
jgi:hypothetical protein